MKRYYNATTNEWYTEGQTMTKRLDSGVFSGVPTEEQLAEWGFVEWIEPAPTPQQLLEKAKQDKIYALQAYDSSDAVNDIIVNVSGGETLHVWVTPEQRSDYKNSIDAAELLGMTEVHPVLNGVTLTLDIQTAKTALAKVQIYANQAYGVTETHRAAINALETIEAVEAYDFTTGYPEKLVFNL